MRRFAAFLGRHAVPWLLAVALILVVWRYVLFPRASPVFLASPAEVGEEILDLMRDGVLWPRITRTVTTALGGLLIGGGAGVALALLITRSRAAARATEPLVVSVYAMPKIVLVPLVFLWFGRGVWPRIGFVALGAFAILYIHAATGARTVPVQTVRALELMGSTRLQLQRLLVLPHISRYVAAGVAIAAPLALVTTVVVEVLLARDGLGGLLGQETAVFNARGVLAVVVVSTVLGLLLTALGRGLVRLTGGVPTRSR